MKIQAEPFRKIGAASAAEIAARIDLSAEARAFLLPTLSPQGFLALLVEAQMMGDAIRFLAFALPAREAIWWACAVAHTTLPEQTELDRACIEHSASWVYGASEQMRRACFVRAEQAKFEGAAAYAALAVFWSGGSLAPEGMPDVVADPKLCPIGVGASVLLSITSGDPLGLALRFEQAIERGVIIANGGNGWLKDDRPLKLTNQAFVAPVIEAH